MDADPLEQLFIHYLAGYFVKGQWFDIYREHDGHVLIMPRDVRDLRLSSARRITTDEMRAYAHDPKVNLPARVACAQALVALEMNGWIELAQPA